MVSIVTGPIRKSSQALPPHLYMVIYGCNAKLKEVKWVARKTVISSQRLCPNTVASQVVKTPLAGCNYCSISKPLGFKTFETSTPFLTFLR